MLTHGVVGAQLSWVLRPFVGNPTLPVLVLRSHAWDGSFFEAVYDMTLARMGPSGPAGVCVVLIAVVFVVAMHLEPAIERCEVHRDRIELWREGALAGFSIPLALLRDVSVERDGVRLHWVDEGSLERLSELIPAQGDGARALYERIAWAMRGGDGYRSAGAL